MIVAAPHPEFVARVLEHARHALAVRAAAGLEAFPRRNGTIVEPLHHRAFPRSLSAFKPKLRSPTDA